MNRAAKWSLNNALHVAVASIELEAKAEPDEDRQRMLGEVAERIRIEISARSSQTVDDDRLGHDPELTMALRLTRTG